jgi:hypothetical protein
MLEGVGHDRTSQFVLPYFVDLLRLVPLLIAPVDRDGAPAHAGGLRPRKRQMDYDQTVYLNPQLLRLKKVSPGTVSWNLPPETGTVGSCSKLTLAFVS